MLFNSYVFLILFLPLTLLGFLGLARWTGRRTAVGWLVFCSLFFYGFWNPVYLALIGASITANFSVGYFLSNSSGRTPNRRALLAAGVVFNLGLLGYFKYANFFVESFGSLLATGWEIPPIVLPLAISFFTFQQISYLVDAYQGAAGEHSFLDYCLFVTFFPQLIAGPIVHHSEMLPQFENRGTYRYDPGSVAVGLSIFTVGLFKKVVLADTVAQFANPTFDGALMGQAPQLMEAWVAAFSYTFQLYFDFSGYSDMAIGLGRMFGVKLPLNFNSPYRSLDISEFWRRWHITLSRFLRDYLYIPLGGNRRGTPRRYLNLMITMLLGGLWHGAGWTFVLWGGLHGAYLCVHHGWGALCKRSGLPLNRDSRGWRAFSRVLTLLAVVVGWVFFRAESFDGALLVLSGMAGFHGWDPAAIAIWAPALALNLGLLAIAWSAPNTMQLFARFEPAYGWDRIAGTLTPVAPRLAWLVWRPAPALGLAVGATLVCVVLSMSRTFEFLYFQF
jgi:D-alanyl-lipoteichoic acid acyltransferase DltB (MBOAT superfamily)